MRENNNDRELGVIRSTMLGIEDHGVFTFMLDLDFGETGQGFGGYGLGGSFAASCITGILNAVGVKKWEDLKGRQVWVRRAAGAVIWGGGDKIVAIEAPAFVQHEGGEFDIGKAAQEYQASDEYKQMVAEKGRK